MFEYQVSLFCQNGKYRPVSTIVRRKAKVDLTNATDKKKLWMMVLLKFAKWEDGQAETCKDTTISKVVWESMTKRR